jgi:glycosyltransferase involved in cell wall biosynthesis
VKKFQKGTQNVLLIQDHGWRGRARQIGIEHVETEWFMFVDSDVQLCKGWLEKAKNFASAQVGAVWGIDVWTIIKNPRFLRLFLHLTMSIFQARGGTHDLLVRREAVKDIKIPNTLYSFEDAYIKESINKRGYEVIGAYDPYCIHYRRLTACSIKSAFDMAQSARALIRAGMFHKYSKLLLSYGFFTAYFVYQNLRQTRVLYSSSKTR